MSEDRLLKVKDVAQRLNVREEAVRIMLRTGKLRGVKLGGTKLGYRVAESEVERLLSDAAPQEDSPDA